MRIEEEIRQRKFQDEHQKVHVNILFTASWLEARMTALLKPYRISMQQFNILRILRGIYPEAESLKYLSERMLDKMSNASRLVEKLAQKGYVDRITCPQDGRRLEISITPLGLEILEKASRAFQEELSPQLRTHLSDEEASTLNRLLDQLRG